MGNKILDLSVYQQTTFDITFPSGEVLKVKKPTQAIVIEMVALSQKDQNNQAALLESLVDVCAAVLSNNTEGKQFTAEWVSKELDIVMISAIIRGYSDFIQELQSNPF